MATAVGISRGLALPRFSINGLNSRTLESHLGSHFAAPALGKCSASKCGFASGKSLESRQVALAKVRCTAERTEAKEEKQGSLTTAGWSAGLTMSSAVCLMELLSANSAEAAHAPRIDAADFFLNLDFNGLLEFGLTSVGFLVLYFLVVPPVLLTYFLQRWKKKKLAETIFMFAMTFTFFPGLMLWAPFINTRPFPRSTGRYTAETDKVAFRGEEWRSK